MKLSKEELKELQDLNTEFSKKKCRLERLKFKRVLLFLR